MGLIHFLFLSYLGFAINVQAQNCSQPVPGPNMQIKGNDILLQMFPDRAKVYFACNVGYQPTGGSAVITCNSGNWSPVRLKCEKKSCGPVGELINGQIDYLESTEFGDKAVMTCNPGYVLVGRGEVICEDQGWSGRLPVCEEVVCDPPPQIVDGTYSPESDVYSYRDVVQYRCKKDYTLTGPKSRTCSEDGTFKPDPPTCSLIQCEEPAVDNADWIRRPPYRPGSTVTLQCRSGYDLKGEQTQSCALNGQWSPGLPTCEPKSCSRPVLGPNMSLQDSLSQTFVHGTTVSFACNVGYMSAGGSAAITCTFGTWSPVMLKCQRKNCGPAGEVTNGQIDYREGTEFGDNAVISCDIGFILVGKSKLTCYDQGWSGRLPVCEVVTCDPPPEIVGGTFSPDKEVYSYRDAVQYKCKDDYTLIGPKSRTCSEDGTFKPDPPRCALIKCEDPAVENADWIRRPPYLPGSTVTLQCRSGYVLKGDKMLTCDKGGRWSPLLPTCEQRIIECEEPYVANSDRIFDSQGPNGFLHTVTFRCRSGYNMVGVDTQTCEADGNWSPGLPTCEHTGNAWQLVLCFVAGVLTGVLVTLLAKSLWKKKRSQKNGESKKNGTNDKGDSELQALK